MNSPNVPDPVAQLKELIKKTVDFFDAQRDFDESRKHIWVKHAEDLYADFERAWSAYSFLIWGTLGNPLDARRLLEIAADSFEELASELSMFQGATAADLVKELRSFFEQYWNEMDLKLTALSSESDETAEPRAIKTDVNEYRLICSVCKDAAASFAMEASERSGEKELVYTGVVVRAAMPVEEASVVFEKLEKDDLEGVHLFLKRRGLLEDGLDAYCPDCDVIYCRDHYNVRESWNAGFYDCTFATCPRGHERVIDR